ncbi:MAG TPA: TspO/MBR family protein [Candidatus Acidoferrum sp.]|nr:TspO/MBR family protein [Candidatus Acidoferrum sp.]
MAKQKPINWLAVTGCIASVELLGNIGSLATFSQITTWYALLAKPFFNPPSWIFGPVWTLLFALMGVAVYLIWRAPVQGSPLRLAYGAFALQLMLNILWSFIFFGWHQPFIALLEIIILALAIVLNIREFAKVSAPAAWLMVPYLMWVLFATILNMAIWLLN